jgi:hypothetical protein
VLVLPGDGVGDWYGRSIYCLGVLLLCMIPMIVSETGRGKGRGVNIDPFISTLVRRMQRICYGVLHQVF